MLFLPAAAHAPHTYKVTTSLCARCGWHNPTPAAESLATLHWENHNIMKSHTAMQQYKACSGHTLHPITLETAINYGSI